MGKPTLLPKGRSLSSEMTGLVAEAAGNLAKAAVKAAAKKGRTAVAERLPRPVKRAANTIEAPKKTAKKTARKSNQVIGQTEDCKKENGDESREEKKAGVGSRRSAPA